MRSNAPFHRAILTAALLGLTGCVLSVLPANKPTEDKPSTVVPVPQVDQAPHHTDHYYRCKEGFKPLTTDDRPRLGDVDPSDKAKLNMALADYIHHLDVYMSDHQRKEEKAYRAWRSECDDFLN